ncbi:MAG: TonB-dependent receptor, partial [Desulfobacterales bacterium]|nr:TonB-dependent receptor [Desulfobacterales bacterium]
GAGTEERGFGGVRYGARVGENAHIRAYARYVAREASAADQGIDDKDDFRRALAGFRFDSRFSAVDSLTIQGDVVARETDLHYRRHTTSPPYRELSRGKGALDGGNILARWTRAFSQAGDLTFQMYYDRAKMVNPAIDELRDAFDMDIQHGFTLGERHNLLWGLEYRWTRDRQGKNDGEIVYIPSKRSMELFSLFIQDRITLWENRLWLTIGARFENGYYSGWETQPTGRLLWKPLEKHTFWAAVSRAVRTPSRTEKDARAIVDVLPPGSPGNPTPLPLVAQLNGSPDYASETLTAYEAGYRFQPSERFFCDLAVFYNDYGDLRSLEIDGPLTPDPGPPPFLTAPMAFTNGGDGQSRGVELAVDYLPLDWWRLRFAYTWFRAEQSDNALDGKGASPEHQIGVRSSMDLPFNLELDVWPRHVGELPDLDIESYIAMDIRLGWRPSENLDVSLVGQNLFREEGPEFQDQVSPFLSTAVEQAVYGKITWRF